MSKAIYLLEGEEDYLISAKLKELTGRISNPELNLEVIEAPFAMDRLFNALQVSPLLGGDKLILLKNFKATADNQDGLIEIFNNMPGEVTVVFVSPQIDKRSKLFRLIASEGVVLEFKPFAPWQLTELSQWIAGEFTRQGKEVSGAVCLRLIEISGTGLRPLHGEIEKIVTYIGERKTVTEADIVALAAPGEKNIFQLLDALRQKQLALAMSVFRNLLNNKEDMFGITAMLAKQYRALLQIKSQPPQKTYNHLAIAQQIRENPYFIKKCLADLHRFTILELRQAMEKILIANKRLKSGRSQPLQLEILITELCGQ
ncbi:DNA polymerase III subunit delta [candidate division WOR-1 bacterium RIFOXYB2_FULL_48_7]|uniref:DNA polymerase III subunit delta n=1 Tax=candidate division WOR-1 bacterium RIFOXYB2_FULL_48_7 TaxID=1802583 RepID=A0A1F4TRS0_UNCSA|nr:MAG: DNA polymerase III subunit delta [candidate division WOR-1 bacterium RIFOXYB2_FULL_48_7]